MSGLSSRRVLLVDYEESDPESSDEGGHTKVVEPPARPHKKARQEAPPLPDSFLSFLEDTKPSKGTGMEEARVRTTPHIEGNWATHVFIQGVSLLSGSGKKVPPPTLCLFVCVSFRSPKDPKPCCAP